MGRFGFSWRHDGPSVARLAFGVAVVALGGLVITDRAMALSLGAALILSVTAGAIAVHDLKTYWIPDRYTLAFAGVGALTTMQLSGSSALGLAAAISGVVALSLWGLASLYERVLGRAGFGLGDVKLVAASALFVSPAGLVVQLGLAAALALAFAGWRAIRRGRRLTRTTRVPFGMTLAPAAVIVWAAGWSAGS